VTVALRFSRYRDFSFWLASNVPAVMFPSRGRAERAAIRAAEEETRQMAELIEADHRADCVRRQREREEFDQAMEAAALDHQRAAQEAERDRRDAREAAARGKILCATCGCWTDPLEDRCWSCEQPPGLGDGLVEPPFARLYELSVEALRERREAAGG
jgi:hypothetical protein